MVGKGGLDTLSKQGDEVMSRKWLVEINGKRYIIEARYGFMVISGSGELLVDGQVIDAWGSSLLGLPKERGPFEVEGKKVFLRRRGVINQNMDLFVNGKLIKPGV